MKKISKSDPYRGIANANDSTLLIYTDGKGDFSVPVGLHCSSLDLTGAKQSRHPYNYPHRPAYEGSYWFATTGCSVWHESLTERYVLMQLDRAGTIKGIVSQPFCLLFSDGTRHYPDFFADFSTGERMVIDVRSAALMDSETRRKFRLTAEAACQAGWAYEVFGDTTGPLRKNLDWLAPYRRLRYRPTHDEYARIITLLDAPQSMGWIIDALTKGPFGRLGHLYHLMWTGLITFNEDILLNEHTMLKVTAFDE